jgi:4a-hydroxytetrahydrobiopterin dehydratase
MDVDLRVGERAPPGGRAMPEWRGKPRIDSNGYKYCMAPELLTDEAVVDALGGLDWQRDGDELVKTETLKDFAAALAFVNEVGALAERRDHHPDIAISWNKVTLRLSTHSAGGLTQLDIDLAKDVDSLRA